MLINFFGQTANGFFIPSFTLSKGEIVIIHLPNEALIHEAPTQIIKLLLETTDNNRIEINSAFRYVKHLRESRFGDLFIPMTINRYHNRYANKANTIYKKIYDLEWMRPDIKINTLGGKVKRLLSLYTTLSWTNNIIFDLVGVDPQGGKDIYKYVKTIVEKGGAVIMFDTCDEFKNDCNAFVKVECMSNVI